MKQENLIYLEQYLEVEDKERRRRRTCFTWNSILRLKTREGVAGNGSTNHAEKKLKQSANYMKRTIIQQGVPNHVESCLAPNSKLLDQAENLKAYNPVCNF